MRFSPMVLTLLSLSLPAAGVSGVSVDYAKGVDFSHYRTFGWVEGTTADDPRVDELLRKAIRRQLESKGLTESVDEPDLLVRARVVVRGEERHDVDILGYENRWADSATPLGQSGEYLREIEVGSLVVDLLDGHSKLQVWRGMTGAVVRSEVGKKTGKRIDRAIGRMLEKFPPE